MSPSDNNNSNAAPGSEAHFVSFVAKGAAETHRIASMDYGQARSVVKGLIDSMLVMKPLLRPFFAVTHPVVTTIGVQVLKVVDEEYQECKVGHTQRVITDDVLGQLPMVVKPVTQYLLRQELSGSDYIPTITGLGLMATVGALNESAKEVTNADVTSVTRDHLTGLENYIKAECRDRAACQQQDLPTTGLESKYRSKAVNVLHQAKGAPQSTYVDLGKFAPTFVVPRTAMPLPKFDIPRFSMKFKPS